MSREELFKKYQEIILKTNGGADDYVIALCQISDLIRDYSEEKDQQLAQLKAENENLQQQLKDNTKQVCEKIRKEFEERLTGYKWEDKLLVGKFCNITNDILDQIEKGE